MLFYRKLIFTGSVKVSLSILYFFAPVKVELIKDLSHFFLPRYPPLSKDECIEIYICKTTFHFLYWEISVICHSQNMYSQEPINFWDEKVQVQFQNSIKNIDTPGNTWQQKYFSQRIFFWAEIIYSSTFLFLVGTKEHLSIHNPQQYNLKLYIKRCKSPNLIRYQNIVLSHKRGMEWKIIRSTCPRNNICVKI